MNQATVVAYGIIFFGEVECHEKGWRYYAIRLI